MHTGAPATSVADSSSLVVDKALEVFDPFHACMVHCSLASLSHAIHAMCHRWTVVVVVGKILLCWVPLHWPYHAAWQSLRCVTLQKGYRAPCWATILALHVLS